MVTPAKIREIQQHLVGDCYTSARLAVKIVMENLKKNKNIGKNLWRNNNSNNENNANANDRGLNDVNARNGIRFDNYRDNLKDNWDNRNNSRDNSRENNTSNNQNIHYMYSCRIP